MFERVHHVAYTVDDLESYVDFFGDVLGMDAVDYRELPDAGYKCAVYAVGETYVEIQEPTDNEGMEAWLEEHGNGLNHVSFGVSDLDTTLDALRERGIESEHDEPIEAPTFPGRRISNMDRDTSRGIYLQITEEPNDE